MLGGSGLSLGGCGSYGQIVLSWGWQSGLGSGDDENLFELIEVGCWPKLDEGVGLVVEVWLDGFDRRRAIRLRSGKVAKQS